MPVLKAPKTRVTMLLETVRWGKSSELMVVARARNNTFLLQHSLSRTVAEGNFCPRTFPCCSLHPGKKLWISKGCHTDRNLSGKTCYKQHQSEGVPFQTSFADFYMRWVISGSFATKLELKDHCPLFKGLKGS